MENRVPFGTLPGGAKVELLTLSNEQLSCKFITYGGALHSLTVPDRDGKPADVLLGFDDLESYRKQTCFLGALIGRFGNRIGGARFTLNGKEYRLPANENGNQLHGGPEGFDKKVWAVERQSVDTAELSLHSPDGDMGYPGALDVRATYRLTGRELSISYEAKAEADTICNLTNHAYFNLSGHASGPVSAQTMQLYAGKYLPTDSQSIPTGELAPVDGTPMDLRAPLPIGEKIDADFEQLRLAGGYDHCWVIDGWDGTLRPAARAYSPATGIAMETLTTLPGVQFYSGNYLDGVPAGKGGAPYGRRWAFCLETQFFPDSPNHAGFPSATLRGGQTLRSKTVYRFSAE